MVVVALEFRIEIIRESTGASGAARSSLGTLPDVFVLVEGTAHREDDESAVKRDVRIADAAFGTGDQHLVRHCAVGTHRQQAELSALSKIGWAPRHLFICHKRCAVQLGVAPHRVMLHIDDARTFRRNPAQSFRTPFVAPCKIGLHLGGTVGDRPLHSEVLHQPVLHEPIVGEGACRRIRTREVLRLRVEELDCRRSAIVPRSRIAIAGNAPARLRVRENPVEVLPESPHGICSALCRLDEPVA